MVLSLYSSLHVELLGSRSSTLGQIGWYWQLFGIFFRWSCLLFGPWLIFLGRLFVVVLVLLCLHVLHLVLSLFTVVFSIIVTFDHTFSHLDQGDLSS